MKTLLTALIGLVSMPLYSQKLTLSTVLPTNRFIINEEVELVLTVEEIPENIITKEDNFEVNTKNEFTYAFSIIPSETGKIILGPYSINLNGKTLESNTLKLAIREELKQNEIRISCPNKVMIGEGFTIELTSTQTHLAGIKLKASNHYLGKNLGSSSTAVYKNGKSSSEYTIRFKVLFDTSGEYTINESWFENIPTNLILRPEKIKVIE